MAENKEIITLEENKKVQEYSEKLRALREDGVTKINDCRIELASLKKNKLIDEAEKSKRIQALNAEIAKAKEVEARNRAEIASLSKEAVKYVNTVSKDIEASVNARQNKRMEGAKSFYEKEVAQIKQEAAAREAEVRARLSGGDPQVLKSEIEICRYELKSALYDSKSRFKDQMDRAKAAKHQAFVDHIQKNRELRNGKSAFGEDVKMKWKNFVRNFTPSSFFLANGLYIAIIIFFIVCIIAAPLMGSGNLLSLPNILTILEQASTRMFYALGVAGLILLAGTDLSIGRMVALGSVTTGLILHPGMNIVALFGLPTWDFSALPMGVRVLMALSLAVVLVDERVTGHFDTHAREYPHLFVFDEGAVSYSPRFGVQGCYFEYSFSQQRQG